MKNLLLLFSFLFIKTALSQAYLGKEKPEINHQNKAANCVPPRSYTMMEANNVRALIHTGGNLWQKPGQNLAQYEVPKNSGIMAMFTSALWLGGTDVNGQLKLAALRYREGQDYWTGPISKGFAITEQEICNKYDKHFVTIQDEIKQFDAWWEAGVADAKNGTKIQQTLFSNYQIPRSIKEWPAHGDISLGHDYYLAPFYDRDNDGNYDWEKGDFPWYDFKKTKSCSIDREVSLYGDQNFWWIMNDKGNIHTETGADPIGMEIRAQAFIFATNDEINNMTFYNYELINRGTQTLTNTYFGMFVDGALGDPFDDFVGCDVNRGLGYFYNGDEYDGDNQGFKGYGYTPPAIGVDFFEGPYQDDDGVDNAFGIGPNQALNGIGYGDGTIDNERFGMRRFLYYVNTGSSANINTTDPITATDYYNYLRGFWKDNTPFLYGGSGHHSDPKANTNVRCDFLFPGDTDPLGWGTNGNPQAPWTEESAGNVPYDRRFLQSAGPFVLKPGAVNNITVGVAWARANSGGPFASVNVLKRADDKAQSLFENCFKVLEGPHAPNLTFQELNKEIILMISNPVNSNNYNEEYEEVDPAIITDIENADRSYRFQGYQLFQVKNAAVSASELEDPSKARLVAQTDIKDNVSKIINFEFDNDLDFSIPVLKVNGNNKGIQHSFRVTEDLFATGERRLVNFKKYYFIAIAYAYNNYKDYKPNDPDFIDGQKRKYLSSRKAPLGEILTIEAMPHNSTPKEGGTIANVSYGDGPEITRYDGRGNGNNVVDLTENSIKQIIENGFLRTPTYQGGASPINIKVVDPLNVASGYFELKFNKYTNEQSNEALNGIGIDTASWTIYRYENKGGKLLDSVNSDRTIASKLDDPARPWLITSNNPQKQTSNEQLIPEWGVSVQIFQEKYFIHAAFGPGNVERRYTNPIEATLTYSDSSKNWIRFIQDRNTFTPFNWIRSGMHTVILDDCLPNEIFENPCDYPDEVSSNDVGVDYLEQYSKLLGGGIAPWRLVGYQSHFMPFANPSTSGTMTQARNRNSIMRLPSVDIVFTNDKNLWTRCAVIELGRDKSLNIGAAAAGTLRKSLNVGKNGLPDGSVYIIESDTINYGMGWFPGYAIDVETGMRLYMAFGENSFLGKDNGADMIWNPTSKLISSSNTPVFGGLHPIYVFGYNITGEADQNKNCPYYKKEDEAFNSKNWVYTKYVEGLKGKAVSYVDVFSNLSWVSNLMLAEGKKLLDTEAKIRVRINKEYNDFHATSWNNGKPMYAWSMDKLSATVGSADALKDALKLINVVPNPYYAHSEYERSKIDTRIKIINLPEKCTIKIYNISGKLIKTFKKDNPITFQDWNLTNEKFVPVSSGVFLIHVIVPDIGEVILKSFISQRAPDLEGY
jgi:hypothetical protein